MRKINQVRQKRDRKCPGNKNKFVKCKNRNPIAKDDQISEEMNSKAKRVSQSRN